MSADTLPSEILQIIFQFLDGVQVLRCQAVCRSWREAFEDLTDLAWKNFCERETHCRDKYATAKQKYGFTWRQTYKQMNSWFHIDTAEINIKQLGTEVQRFKIVVPNGTIACLYNINHQHKSNKLNEFSDTIVYYDLETYEECKREEFDYCFRTNQFDENEHFLVFLDSDYKLCIILKTNKKKYLVAKLEVFGAFFKEEIRYTINDTNIYYMDDAYVISVSKLIDDDGQAAIQTTPLMTFPQRNEFFEENVIAISCKDGNPLYILTDHDRVFIRDMKTNVFAVIRSFESRDETHTILKELDTFDFNWKSQAIFDWLAHNALNKRDFMLDSSEREFFSLDPSRVVFHIHQYSIGKIILTASIHNSLINIHNYRYDSFYELRDVIDAVEDEPVTTIVLRGFEDVPPNKCIKQLDIAETPSTHKIIVLAQGKLLILELKHCADPKNVSRMKKIVKLAEPKEDTLEKLCNTIKDAKL